MTEDVDEIRRTLDGVQGMPAEHAAARVEWLVFAVARREAMTDERMARITVAAEAIEARTFRVPSAQDLSTWAVLQ